LERTSFKGGGKEKANPYTGLRESQAGGPRQKKKKGIVRKDLVSLLFARGGLPEKAKHAAFFARLSKREFGIERGRTARGRLRETIFLCGGEEERIWGGRADRRKRSIDVLDWGGK